MNVKSGRFISVEGGEGAGKSVFLRRLAAHLRDLGIAVVTTREPGGTPGADRIRALFGSPPEDDSWTIEAEALLVSASRAQHVGRLIRPTLQAGRWIISDRYHDSMRAYQGGLGGVDGDWLEQLIRVSTGALDPDLTFLLDVDVGVALERLKARHGEGERDAVTRYDAQKREAHEALRRAFLKLAEKFKSRIIVLDATLSPERLSAEALRIVEERFLK